MIISKILKEYQALLKDYGALNLKAYKALEKALVKDSIKFHKIESRIKTRKTIEAKIIRKNFKYSTIKEITDVLGLRVIVLYEDEIDKVAKVVKRLFNIDPINSVDRIDFLDTDRFGYRSLHYVVTLRNHSLKFEVQIRTILQHAWAELSHRLGYKTELEIPKASLREFSRLSGLLEIGDYAFIKLRKELFNYSKSIKDNIKKPSKIDINKESIRAFINHDRLIKSIDQAVLTRIKGSLVANDYFEDELKITQYLKLNKLSDLKSLIRSNKDLIVQSAIRTQLYMKEKMVTKGIGIIFLGYIIADRNGQESEIYDLLNKIELLPSSERRSFALTLHNRINNYK